MTHFIFWNSVPTIISRVDFSEKKYMGVTRPLALHHMASWLEEYGMSTKVIDFCSDMNTDDLVEITKKYISEDTVAIGVSATFYNGDPSSGWLADAKRTISNEFNHIKWVTGGPVTSSTQAFSKEWIRFSGYCEHEFLSWAIKETNSKNTIINPYDIKTSVVKFKPTDFIQPTEALPFEAFRGCKFSCKFCSYPGIGNKSRDYIKSPELIKETFLRNYHEFGTSRYKFMMETCNEDLDFTKSLAKIAQSLPFELEWVGFLRLDLISAHNNASELYDSGLRGAFFGIETFHPEAAKTIGKGFNGIKGKSELTKLISLWNRKVSITCAFIAGLPGESKEHFVKSIDWASNQDIDRIIVNPLNLNLYSSSTSENMSEFSKNWSKYGYTVLHSQQQRFWESSIMTQIEAQELSSALNAKLQYRNKFSAWERMGVLSLGLPPEAVDLNFSSLDQALINDRKATFIANYAKYQKEL